MLATGMLRLVRHRWFQVALYLIILSAIVLVSYTVGMARLVRDRGRTALQLFCR